MSATKEFHHDEIESNRRFSISLIKDYPVLFDTEMVQATLSRKKTETRRLFKSPLSKAVEPAKEIFHDGTQWVARLKNGQCYKYPIICPYGETGDLLWVKETWAPTINEIAYKADYSDSVLSEKRNQGLWHPSIHMPKTVSRLWLLITDLKPQRIQTITEQEARQEGTGIGRFVNFDIYPKNSYRAGFFNKWKSIYGIESWYENPWVWAIKFEIASLNKIPPV